MFYLKKELHPDFFTYAGNRGDNLVGAGDGAFAEPYPYQPQAQTLPFNPQSDGLMMQGVPYDPSQGQQLQGTQFPGLGGFEYPGGGGDDEPLPEIDDSMDSSMMEIGLSQGEAKDMGEGDMYKLMAAARQRSGQEPWERFMGYQGYQLPTGLLGV